MILEMLPGITGAIYSKPQDPIGEYADQYTYQPDFPEKLNLSEGDRVLVKVINVATGRGDPGISDGRNDSR